MRNILTSCASMAGQALVSLRRMYGALFTAMPDRHEMLLVSREYKMRGITFGVLNWQGLKWGGGEMLLVSGV